MKKKRKRKVEICYVCYQKVSKKQRAIADKKDKEIFERSQKQNFIDSM